MKPLQWLIAPIGAQSTRRTTLQSGVIEKDNTRITIRAPVTGDVGPAFRAAGVALPPNTDTPLPVLRVPRLSP